MTHISKSALAPHSQKDLFELINNVVDYPNFIPYCTDSELIESSDNHIVAKLCFSKGPMRQTFITRNELVPYHTMHLHLVDGPFKHLNGRWEFTEKNANCTLITFELDYDFKSIILANLFGSVFKKVSTQMIDSFCQRADELFGPKGAS